VTESFQVVTDEQKLFAQSLVVSGLLLLPPQPAASSASTAINGTKARRRSFTTPSLP
jgi:hypothetical protein